jgi:hypothetical protein
MSSNPFPRATTVDRLTALDRRAMPDTCNIVRPVAGPPNADNSPSDGTWYTQYDIPCRYEPHLLRTVEILLEMRIVGDVRGVMHLPKGTDVVTTDAIDFGGRRYEIVGDNLTQTTTTAIILPVRLVS